MTYTIDEIMKVKAYEARAMDLILNSIQGNEPVDEKYAGLRNDDDIFEQPKGEQE